MASFRALREDIYDRNAGRDFHRAHLEGLSAWDRHKLYISNFVNRYNTSKQITAPTPDIISGIRTDDDLLREHHEFIRQDEGQAPPGAAFEVRLACKYYQKLVKEYAICDLSRYRESKVGLRWRTEREVVTGKGQFECGSRVCRQRAGLASFEVPFAYREKGEAKEALVKVRVCEDCAIKLNWKKEKQLRKLEKAVNRLSGKHKRGSPSGDERPAKRPTVQADADIPDKEVSQSSERLHAHGSATQASRAAGLDATQLASKGAAEQQRSEGEFWKAKPKQEVVIEDEFDLYFDDMFA